jgi:hypothetical protein
MADIHLIHFFTGALFASGATVEEAAEKIGEIAGYADTACEWVNGDYRVREHDLMFHAVRNHSRADDVDPDSLLSHVDTAHLGYVAVFDADDAKWIYEAA